MNKFIHFYRVIDGRRVRFRLTLDDSNTEVSLLPVEAGPALPLDPSIPANAPPELKAYLATLLSQGYKFRVSDDLKIHMLYTPPERLALAYFFLDEHPCWFPECEQLRQEYKEALRSRSATGEIEDCAGCDIVAIRRQFEAKVLPYLTSNLATHHAIDQSTPQPSASIRELCNQPGAGNSGTS